MDKPIGKVAHYYDKIGVAVVDITTGAIKIGDSIKFKLGDDEFSQVVESLQMEHKSVSSVKKGDSFGLKVSEPTKRGTLVYLVS
ncbi:MAG: hypothetical protein HY429_03980 [Candidatus Levybacteria bacterium]|nr:hypothetical protein [Candidatus Levybacteria bacterium]